MKRRGLPVAIRNTRTDDFDRIIEICSKVYPESPPWKTSQLASHLRVFTEGQFVAVEREHDLVVGMASSLIVLWDDYDTGDSWRDFTDHGMFTNHDPESGHTLYAAEIMVDPEHQRRGIGKALYAARRDLVRRLGLWRIRAGARLRGYHRYAHEMPAHLYAEKVAHGELFDPTVSFQIQQGFRVIGIVSGYLRNDPESRGYAALIEWLNPDTAAAGDAEKADPRFRP